MIPVFNMYNDSVSNMRHRITDIPDVFDLFSWSIPSKPYSTSNSAKAGNPVVAIENISFNVPVVTVKWSDSTETVAIDDRLVKYQTSISVNEEQNTIMFIAGENKLKMDYKRWKTNFLTQAIVKKLVPNYFDILDKYI